VTGSAATLVATLPLGAFPLLVTLALQATAVLAVATLLALALRRRSAAARHLVWGAAFGVLALLPLAAGLRDWWTPARHPGGVSPGTVSLVGVLDVAPARGPTRARVLYVVGDSATPAPSRGADAVATRAALAALAATRRAGTAMPRTTFTWWLASLWLAGTLAIAVRYLVGTLVVRRWTRDAAPLDDERWRATLMSAQGVLRLRRAPTLCISPRVRIPLVWGVRHPVVLLPPHARDWTEDRRRAVLVHELAHALRRDGALELVVQVATAALWFHPAVHAAARRLRLERERACDDLVVGSGVGALDYAEQLLAVLDGARDRAPVAALALAHEVDLERRLRSLLARDTPRGRPPRAVGRAIALAVPATAILLAVATSDPRARTAGGVLVRASGTPSPSTMRRPAADLPHLLDSLGLGRAGVGARAGGTASLRRPQAGTLDSPHPAPARPDTRTP
jgi:beta-lactamase regulating signal transducer with metallopeptidase domain